jgi:cyclohexadieny/prephenate dehydrogenase
MNHLLIIGFGLMGCSVALAARAAYPGAAITVVDPSDAHRAYALDHGLAEATYAAAESVPQRANLAVIAAPVRYIGLLAASALSRSEWVTDIGSVKRLPLKEARALVSDIHRFVPAHPIAGSEKTGPEYGSAALLQGRRCILTPQQSEADSISAVSAFWQALGMVTESMAAEQHDHIYALVSHLPQKLAFDYADRMTATRISEAEHMPHTQGFLRLTRSNRSLWAEIFAANADFLDEEHQRFQALFAAQHPQMQRPSREDLLSGRYGQAMGCALLSLLSDRSEALQCSLLSYAGTGLQSFTSLANLPLSEPSS